MEITITVLITVIAGALGTILSNYLWNFIRNERIRTKRIISSNDKSTESLIELYSSLFPDDGTNYSINEILDFIDVKEYNKNRHIVAENIVLVSLFKSEVVGFIFCHFYPDKKMAIISYLGINRDIKEACQSASKQLLKCLKDILIHETRKCQFVFFDILKPDTIDYSKENCQRKARNQLFKLTAKLLGYVAYEFEFNYISPKINIAEGAHEQHLILLCIPFEKVYAGNISKDELMKFIEFIYLDCYGDIYTLDDPRFYDYQEHLKQKCELYKYSLPNMIPIIK